jgi:15-cis-phytoene desaturase
VPDENARIQADVVVVGGGLAGLTSAVGLCRAGLRVVVVERDRILGGRAASFRDGVTGDAIPIGPHIFASEYPNTLALLDLLGTRDRIVWHDVVVTMVEGRHRSVMKMSPLPAPFHFVPSLIADPWLRNRDWLSNTPVTLFALTLDEDAIGRLDEVAALPLLGRLGVTERYIDRFWRFASLSIMNVPLERCSAGALLRFYRRLIGKRGYRIGFPDEGLGDVFAPGCRRMIEDHGGRVLVGTDVARIMDDGPRACGVELADGRRIDAQFTVAALPPHALQSILPTAWVRDYPGFANLDRSQPCPYLSVFLWFDRKLTAERFWARLHRPGALNCDFYDLSNINRGWSDRPSVVASNIIYTGDAWDSTDEQIVEKTVAELAEYLPEAASATITHAVVHRIPMAIPCPFVGAERLRLDNVTPIDGLVLAGDWLKTGLPPSMESACFSGWRAAEVVLAAVGRPATLARRHIDLDPIASMLGKATGLLIRAAARIGRRIASN